LRQPERITHRMTALEFDLRSLPREGHHLFYIASERRLEIQK
jgi:hypothetical protein